MIGVVGSHASSRDELVQGTHILSRYLRFNFW